MNWQIDYNPEHPEKFPNYRREEDDDEEGQGHAPWAKSMSLSHKYGLDGSYARDKYQTYDLLRPQMERRGSKALNQ